MEHHFTFPSVAKLREQNVYYEVFTDEPTEEMEESALVIAGTDSYYFCSSRSGFLVMRNDKADGHWFFDKQEDAAAFKLMHGK